MPEVYLRVKTNMQNSNAKKLYKLYDKQSLFYIYSPNFPTCYTVIIHLI